MMTIKAAEGIRRPDAEMAEEQDEGPEHGEREPGDEPRPHVSPHTASHEIINCAFRHDRSMPSDHASLQPSPSVAWHGSRKELRVDDLGEDLEALHDAWARTTAVRRRVHRIDASGTH